MSRAPQRIVSLLASGTELCCALGAGDRLVGRSHECDHPAWVKRLPAVSRPTFDVTGSSREIDERVRARLRSGQPLYEVDERAIAALAPDVLITQTHCEVCAVSPADLAHGASPALLRRQVVALRTGSLAWDAVREVDPEVLVVAPCGFGLERSASEMHLFAERPGWGGLRAVREGRVFVADGNLCFNRSGPSVFETPSILAEILHPEHFLPRHEGVAWQRWSA